MYEHPISSTRSNRWPCTIKSVKGEDYVRIDATESEVCWGLLTNASEDERRDAAHEDIKAPLVAGVVETRRGVSRTGDALEVSGDAERAGTHAPYTRDLQLKHCKSNATLAYRPTCG